MRYCIHCRGATYGHNCQGAANMPAVLRRRVQREHHALSRHPPLTISTDRSDTCRTLRQEPPPVQPPIQGTLSPVCHRHRYKPPITAPARPGTITARIPRPERQSSKQGTIFASLTTNGRRSSCHASNLRGVAVVPYTVHPDGCQGILPTSPLPGVPP